MPTQMQTLYTARSGHLAVMAIFLHRGYNAAIPEVGGDDIFVVKDENGDLSRIQVKAANATGVRRRFAQYKLPMAQLKKRHTPELHYVFAMHFDDAWREFLVVPRADLDNHRVQKGIGRPSRNQDYLFLRLSFSDREVWCGEVDFQHYRNNWDRWPVIRH